MGNVFFKIKGLNFDKFLKRLRSLRIEIIEVKKIEYNLFEIGIKGNGKNIFLNEAKKYHFEILYQWSEGFFLKIVESLKKNIALFLCGLVGLGGIIFSSKLLLKIEIWGSQKISSNEVGKVLQDNGMNLGKFSSSYNLDEIENLIINSFDSVSLVSCVVLGNTLVVNIKEKIDNSEIEKEFQPLVAPFDLIVKKIDLKSGICPVCVGQTVKKGQTLIEPFVLSGNGEKLKVEPKGSFEVYAEVSKESVFNENQEIFVRNGNKKEYCNLEIFGLQFKNGSQNQTPFENFEVTREEKFVFKNFLLPIKKEVYTYWEVVKEHVYKKFDEAKEKNLIEESKNILYNLIGRYNIVEDLGIESSTVCDGGIWVVKTTLKVELELKI